MKIINQAICCTNCTSLLKAAICKGLEWYSNILINYTITIPNCTKRAFFRLRQPAAGHESGFFAVPLLKTNCTTRRPRMAGASASGTVGTAKTAFFFFFSYEIAPLLKTNCTPQAANIGGFSVLYSKNRVFFLFFMKFNVDKIQSVTLMQFLKNVKKTAKKTAKTEKNSKLQKSCTTLMLLVDFLKSQRQTS